MGENARPTIGCEAIEIDEDVDLQLTDQLRCCDVRKVL